MDATYIPPVGFTFLIVNLAILVDPFLFQPALQKTCEHLRLYTRPLQLCHIRRHASRGTQRLEYNNGDEGNLTLAHKSTSHHKWSQDLFE